MFKSDVSFLDGTSVLVTGGTGSFGKNFVKTLLDQRRVGRLVIFSRDELKQYEMQQQFADHPHFSSLRFFLGDVRDIDRLRMAFRGIDYVVHAAALKQVVAAEYNPFEFIKTNVIGAENVVRAALDNNVKRIIALSTDKAANPVNLYGTSKLASDKIFVAANHLSGPSETRFAVVRYGNVLGSRGSVVPLFQRLIEQNVAELPITDPRMTRFWITLKQGINFVFSCLEIMHGGEIFVPKIPSMKIIDIAHAMAPNKRHKIIGLRPGEKIHEIMITENDAHSTVELADRYIIMPSIHGWDAQKKFVYPNTVGAVAEDFFFSSDTNSWWMGQNQLMEMLKEDSV